jgi:hypothetical protein
MTGFQFEIKPENIQVAFEASQKSSFYFDYMRTLTEIFDSFGFSAEEDHYGIRELGYHINIDMDITELISFFNAIAPYVVTGSYIEMLSVMGFLWRLCFDGKKVILQFPNDYIWKKQQLKDGYSMVFYQTTRQNYWENTRKHCDYIDEIMFGIQDDKGGTPCELFIRWYDINGKSSPRFEMFVNSIKPMVTSSLLYVLQAVLDYGSDNITPKEFCKELRRMGYVDLSDKPLE